MTRPTRDVSKAILERRRASGLGVACADAQADGVPCDVVHGDCASCQRGAASALAAAAPARRPLSRRPRRRR
ncbi:MAG TPA: hypothetical protein VF832_07590 [Longimicrobiales bacterium]